MPLSRFTQSRFVKSGLIEPKFAGVVAAGAAYVPASYVFNGTDELLTRTLSTTSPSTTKITVSVWAKSSEATVGQMFVQSRIDANNRSRFFGDVDENMAVQVVVAASAVILGGALSVIATDNTWHHYVYVFDSTEAVEEDRIKLYKDGVGPLTDIESTTTSLNESHAFFTNGSAVQIGNGTGFFSAKSLAFIDVLEGVVADASSFGFDNSGTWTRMPYAGSYGTYGFSLDGSDGFNDVSGNAQDFTGTNMDGSNLDTADLPPYTN